MKKFLFAVVAGLGFAAAVGADTPAVVVTPPATTGTVITQTAPVAMTASAPATSARRGLFGRLRNRGTSAPTYAAPVYSTPTTSGTIISTPGAGTVIPMPSTGTVVPTPMPMPTTATPEETSGVIPTAGTVVAASGIVMPADGMVMTAGGTMPTATPMIATTEPGRRMGLIARMRARR